MSNDALWEELREKLPWHKTEEERQMRIKQWAGMDMNGNGYMSLAEVDKGMRDVIQLPVIFDIKPVLIRAFNAAKTKSKSKSEHGDDYVTKSEYRWLLQYIRQYYELWVAFDEIDTSDDRRVSMDEFAKAIPLLETWGLDMSDPEAQWNECDANGGGKILFDEFCAWGIKKHLDLDDDDDDDLA